jgi:hypothetical protein
VRPTLLSLYFIASTTANQISGAVLEFCPILRLEAKVLVRCWLGEDLKDSLHWSSGPMDGTEGGTMGRSRPGLSRR